MKHGGIGHRLPQAHSHPCIFQLTLIRVEDEGCVVHASLDGTLANTTPIQVRYDECPNTQRKASSSFFRHSHADVSKCGPYNHLLIMSIKAWHLPRGVSHTMS